jgi:predicted small lipoprotein YifL
LRASFVPEVQFVRLLMASLLAGLLFMVATCGQKGALRLPDDAPKPNPPATELSSR